VFFETDVLGTQQVANAVLKNRNVERFIHVSTSEVYGTALTEPMTEDHPLNPTTPYASAKTGADRLVYSYGITYDLPAVVVRPFNNYGPHQHLEKVIPRFITSAILNEPLSIHGDGRSSRDWLFVEDHCEVLDRIIHADLKTIRGEVINLGTGTDIDILSIASMLLEMLGKPKTLVTYLGERPGQVQRHIASTNKAERLLGWKASTKFEDGIEKTAKWYRDNRSWWEKLLWMRTVPIKKHDGQIEYH
jgi:dTDP-glucose 4,6-dehydratase